MKDLIQVIILIVAILLALVFLRQCEGPQFRPELTALPIPARTVTQPAAPPPTSTPEPKPVGEAAPEATPLPTFTPGPIKLGEGSGVISGNVRHYRHGTSFIDPYHGAWVALYFMGQKAMQTQTDRAGVFRLTGLPTGTYDLKVFVPTAFANDSTRGINVTDGRETSGVVILIEKEFVPDELNLTFQRGVDEAAARRVIRQHGLTFKKREPESGDYLVKIPAGKFVPDMVKEMKKDKLVRDAVPNYYIYYHD